MPSWIAEEFKDINFGDDRLDSRFHKVAEAFLEKPSATITESTGSWAESKAAYRFFENHKVTKNKMLFQHQAKTVERIREYGGVVLAIQDTTYIDFTQLYNTEGLGPISCKFEHAKQKGIVCHNTLAISPAGRVFGLIDQKLYRRDESKKIGRGPKGTKIRKRIPIEQKESYRWIESVKNVANLAGFERVVHVCDREGDIFELYHELSLTSHQFVIRAFGDRVVGKRFSGRPSIINKNTKLWDFMGGLEQAGTLVVKVPKKNKQTKRKALCEVRYSEIHCPPPYFQPKARSRDLPPLPSLKLYAIWIKEQNPPPDSDPLEWMLITNIEVTSLGEAIEKVEWYKKRWHVDTFHTHYVSSENFYPILEVA